MPSAAFVDVETTGLDPDKDEIVELAIVLFSYNPETGEILEIVDHYSGLREPSCSVNPAATNKHGLTNRTLKGHHLDNARITEILKQADFLIAHNAEFDRSFVRGLFPGVESMEWRCSMNGVNWRSQGFSSKGLQNLLWDHNIVPAEAHRALADVESAIELLSRTGKTGSPYFRELLKSKPLAASRASGGRGWPHSR